ncbi:hypothetical protein [Streptomyces griseoviridis]|uniref:Uncharacterized protein n=1 Tax=Streptomyces griseoviridis TaxID=45398 RepID=A0ABT9LFA1_STRGD|nr:hypothetical protein [Streptomyces griseoviridis]MDP9682396.1 hypothetical protein [Streptomyces griseoviridis]GGS81773.1 hypothetical protein GCM10010240_13910 [Streptomyces griseoviridis]
MTARYFHGGFPGMEPGDRILPPDVTGTERRLSSYAAVLGGPAYAARTDVVYLTTDRQVAKAYAAFYPDGALYEVLPEDTVEADPDCRTPGLSIQCPAALVVAVTDPVVLFRSRTPERWLRMLAGTVPV